MKLAGLKAWLDRDALGAVASLLCSLHCALFPFLLTVLPLIGLSALLSRPFELGMLFLAASIALYSGIKGFRDHGRKRILVGFLLGILLLGLGFFFQHDATVHYISATGGILLVSAHLMNQRQCRLHGHNQEKAVL